MKRRGTIVAIGIMSALLTSGERGQAETTARDLVVASGKSLVIDSPVDVSRVSVANPDVAEAVGITPREVLINGKGPGQTSVVVWQEGGNRMMFDLSVRPQSDGRIEAVRREIDQEVGPGVQLAVDKDAVFVRGVVRDAASADRAVAMASSLGKPVNLLRVAVSESEPQILLKVRFANVDRSATVQLGANIMSTGAGNTIGAAGTGQFSPPVLSKDGQGSTGSFLVSDLLNVFLFNRDLNMAATLRLLQQRNLVEILAEPNLLAVNGKQANFLAGGEFPYPVVQNSGGGGVGTAVTIVFKEFGIRLNFIPTLTTRGTIRLMVEPEVSALDYANGLTYQGFVIPGLTVRRVSTEIELNDRQSFGIAGLMDNRLQDTITKVPGLGDIPLLGKVFQSKSTTRNKTELLVLVTPEIVYPIPAGTDTPKIEFPKEFMSGGASQAPRTLSSEATGTAAPPATAARPVPIEAITEERRASERRDAARHGSGPEAGAGAARK